MFDQMNVIEENARPVISNIPIDDLKLPDRELKVLLALKSFSCNQKADSDLTIANIVKITGKSKRQISEILIILQSKGLIKIETKKGQQQQITLVESKKLSSKKNSKQS